MSLSRLVVAVGLVAVALAGACSNRRASDAQPPVTVESGSPSGREPDSYSAISVRTLESGTERSSVEMRIARDAGRTRQEWTEGDRRFLALVRPDLERAFVVDLDKGVYVEQSLTPAPEEGSTLDGDAVEKLFHEGDPGASVERARSGTATIDGHTCQVFRSQITLPGGTTSEAFVWEADDLGGLAIRSEMREASGVRLVTELRDIRVPADPSLFELPAGARLVEALDN